MISGISAIILTLIEIAFIGIIIFGIIKRFFWARKLAIGWFIIMTVLGIFNGFSFLANDTIFDEPFKEYISKNEDSEANEWVWGWMSLILSSDIFKKMVLTFIISKLIIGVIIISYLYKKKDYFTN